MIRYQQIHLAGRWVWSGLPLVAVTLVLSLLLAACAVTDVASNPANSSNLTVSTTHVLTPAAQSSTSEWPTYLSNNARSGSNTPKAKGALTAVSTPKLKQHWSYDAGRPISTQPVEANGMIYWGDWNGNEHATDLSGHEVWVANLGGKLYAFGT